MKSDHSNPTVGLGAVLKSELKSISEGTKQLWSLKKPLISEANQGKRLEFTGEHKEWTQWKKVR